MQIPIDFYYYIIPGYLNILCLYLLLEVSKKETLEFTKNNALIIIPVSVIIAFLLGFLMQTIISYLITPVLSINPFKSMIFFLGLYNDYSSGQKSENSVVIYSKMVFLRGLWIPMIYLAYEAIKYIWHRTITKFHKFIMTSIIVLSVLSVIIAWYKTRSTFILAIDSNNNTQQTK